MRPFVFLCLIAAFPANAGQPYSQSLAQCAALMDISNRLAPERRSTDNGRKLTQLREAYYMEAVAQAKREGHRPPTRQVAKLYAAAAEDWDSRGLLFLFSEDARDWFAYCRKFGAHLGLVLTR